MDIYAPTASYTYPTGIIPLMSGGLNYQLDAYSSYTVDIKYTMLNRGAIYGYIHISTSMVNYTIKLSCTIANLLVLVFSHFAFCKGNLTPQERWCEGVL